VRYHSGRLAGCGEIARAGEQYSGTADHGTITITYEQANRHAEWHVRCLLAARQYWAVQYSWLNGHQSWRANPLMVVRAWASSHWPTTTPIVRQVNTSTFKVTEPSGKVVTVTGVWPVSVPGPWVITTIT
jgi:hypothetical protein